MRPELHKFPHRQLRLVLDFWHSFAQLRLLRQMHAQKPEFSVEASFIKAETSATLSKVQEAAVLE